jgi:hypothetical protein
LLFPSSSVDLVWNGFLNDLCLRQYVPCTDTLRTPPTGSWFNP